MRDICFAIVTSRLDYEYARLLEKGIMGSIERASGLVRYDGVVPPEEAGGL